MNKLDKMLTVLGLTHTEEDYLKLMVGDQVKDISGMDQGSEEVTIITANGLNYRFYHSQDCCEIVDLEDFELDDVIGATVVSAEIVTSHSGSIQWTFYKIETTKGGIWMRWMGDSEYYSTAISIDCTIVE